MTVQLQHQMINLQRTRTLIETQGGEYYEIFRQLSPEDQEIITFAVARLMFCCIKMGAKGALELLANLGVYLNKAGVVRQN